MPEEDVVKYREKRREMLGDVHMAAKNSHYEYPNKMDLRPGSKLHDYLVEEIRKRAKASHEVLSGAREQWKHLDWTLSAYVPLSDDENIIKARDFRKPVATVIPFSFAARETFLTYMSTAFLQEPIHKISGEGDLNSEVGAACLERLLSAQHRQFKTGLKLTTQWSDAFTYGLGLAGPVWSKRWGTRPVKTVVDRILLSILGEDSDGLGIGDEILHEEEDTLLYEGNELVNIDPYNFLPDPNRNINELQKSEFIGWVQRTNAMELLERERDPEEKLFNGEYARMLADEGVGHSLYWGQDESGRNTRFDTEDIEQSVHQNAGSTSLDRVIFFWKLIPAEHGLGDREKPQIWQFSLAADEVIVQAHPMDLYHGMFPITATAPSTNGHEVCPVSYLATTYGIQQIVDFWISSHVHNVRKAINDMWVFDPSKIEMRDLMVGGPGKMIRIKPGGFGQGNIDQWIKQLQVNDVTGNHLAELKSMIELARETLGTTDITMGNMSNMPERPTATGMQLASSGAVSRLQFVARKIAVQAMYDLGLMEAYNTYQFMDQERAIKITGRRESQLRRAYGLPPDQDTMTVSPFDLDPRFDIEIHSGALPNTENAQAWTQILQTFLGVEGIPERLVQEMGGGILGIFTHWARINGANDITEFIEQANNVNVQVMPDERVQQMVQAGNAVPMEQMVV